MGTTLPTSVFGLLFVGCCVGADADPITLIQHQQVTVASASAFDDLNRRTVEQADTQRDGNSLTATASVTAPARPRFPGDLRVGANTSSAVATLFSSINDPTRFVGSGSTRVTFSGHAESGAAQSQFSVGFHLESPQQFTFASAFGAQNSLAFDTRGISRFTAHLGGGPVGQLFSFETVGRPGMVNETGELIAGDYFFAVGTTTDLLSTDAFPGLMDTGAHFDFTFDLTPIAATPEPASLLLLATGVCGVAARHKRGNKKVAETADFFSRESSAALL